MAICDSQLQVGIGAFVLNEKQEVLLVQENAGVQSGQVSDQTLSQSLCIASSYRMTLDV